MKKYDRIKNLGKYSTKGAMGKNTGHWKGGTRLTKDGYLEIYSPLHPNKNTCNYVLEHRLVMEKKLGRYLTKYEVVHHIDRNRLNNSESNLIIAENQAKHNSYHIHLRDKLGRFIPGGVPND